MNIVIKRVGKNPEVKEINGELNEMQEIVGGYIQAFNVTDNILCVCNEEGKLKGLLPNFVCNHDIICGDVFFCVAGEEDFESLNNEQIEYITNLFNI